MLRTAARASCDRPNLLCETRDRLFYVIYVIYVIFPPGRQRKLK
jgi:hypothetical protein